LTFRLQSNYTKVKKS